MVENNDPVIIEQEDQHPEFVPWEKYLQAMQFADRAADLAKEFKVAKEQADRANDETMQDIMMAVGFFMDLNQVLEMDKLMNGGKINKMAVSGKLIGLMTNPAPLKELARYLPEAMRLYNKYGPMITRARTKMQLLPSGDAINTTEQ